MGLTLFPSIVVTASGSVILDERHYGYNAVGNREWSVQGSLTPSNGTPIGEVYQYDAIDQITGVKYAAENPNSGYASASSPGKTETFAYDAAGNRTSTSTDAATTTYTVNDLNQYTALSGAITETPTWNARGDLATYRDWTYKYDTFGNLRKATNVTQSLAVEYHYDTFGNRAARKEGPETILYLNYGSEVLEEYDADTDTAISTIYEPGIDRPLARINHKTNEIVYYHQDVLSNVVLLTNNNRATVEAYVYDVFGKVTIKDDLGATIATSQVGNTKTFTGRELDPTTGLYHYRARTYHPELGRFIQTDPIDFDAGDLNIYRYVRNNPVNFVDPSGLHTEADCLTEFNRELSSIYIDKVGAVIKDGVYGIGGVFTGVVVGGAVSLAASPPAGIVAGAVVGGVLTGAAIIDGIKNVKDANKRAEVAKEKYEKCLQTCNN